MEAITIGLLIFLARVADVTLGTMRIAFISRGRKHLAPLVGFFEILIWLLALRLVMENLTNVAYYVLFAAGFASGTFVGIRVEEKLAIGSRLIRIVTKTDARNLVRALRESGYGVTSIDAEGNDGRVMILFSIVRRKDLPSIIRLVNTHNPRAFYTIEDVGFVSAGVRPALESFFGRRWSLLTRATQKLK